jgi:hypothetical protein
MHRECRRQAGVLGGLFDDRVHAVSGAPWRNAATASAT